MGRNSRERAKFCPFRSVGVLFIFVGIASLPYFTVENLQRYTLYRTFAGMAVNVVLNLVLIPQYGAKGAAGAPFGARRCAGRLMEGNLRRRVDRNAGWLILDRLLHIPVGLALGVLMVRYLGPAQSGLWNYAIAFSSFFGILTGLAQDQIIVHALVSSPDQENAVLGTSFILKLSGALVALPLSLLACVLFGPKDALSLLLVALSSAGFLFASFSVLDCHFQSALLSRVSVVSRNASFLLLSALKLALLYFRAPLVCFAIANLGDIVLGYALVGRSFYRRGGSVRSWKADAVLARALVREGLPLFVSSFAIVVYTRIDIIMLGMALGDSAVGVYSAAIRLGEAWCFIPAALAASVLPALSQLKNEGNPGYLGELSRVINRSVRAGLVLALFFSVFSRPVISVLYGPQFAGSAEILAIYMWAVLFIFVGISSLPYFTVHNLQRYTLYRTLVGMAANVALNMVLIPRHGAKGAAIATVITQFVASYAFNAVNRETRELFLGGPISFLQS